MNCLNIFLIDGRGGGAGAGVRTRAGAKSRLKEPEVVEPGPYENSSPCAVASQGAESFFDLLGVVEPCWGFL